MTQQTLVHCFPSCDINFLLASIATISSELVLVAVWVHQNSRLCSKENIVKLLGESQYTLVSSNTIFLEIHLSHRLKYQIRLKILADLPYKPLE